MNRPVCALLVVRAPFRQRRGAWAVRCLLGVVMAPLPVTALELPGIYAPSPLADGRGQWSWGNDAFGPAGGSRSDDFRTNQVGLGMAVGPVLIGVDHSILTTTNPTQAPVYWGLPDPRAASRVGAARIDEGTITVGWRPTWSWEERLSLWAQGGVGSLVMGNLQGERLQNGVHAVIAQASITEPYERSRLAVLPLGYVGTGAQVTLAGPAAWWWGAVGKATTRGHIRWQHESLLAATGPAGGCWMGMRWDGVQGEAPSRTADVVDDDEVGPAVITGLGTQVGHWGVRIESLRNLRNDAQFGRFSLAWTPAGEGRAGSGTRGWGRVGLLPQESRVAGRGLDYAYAWEAGPLLLLVGLRDNEMSNHFVEDMTGRRHLLWSGIGQAPVLGTTGPLVWQGWWEAGVGWRHSVVRSRGFLTLDDEAAFHSDAGIARVAVGGGPRWDLGPAASAALLVLGEGVAASRVASTTIAIHDPFTPSIIRTTEAYPVEGSAVGVILAAAFRWQM